MINNVDNIDKAIEEDLIQCSIQQNLDKIDFGSCPICYEDINVLQYNNSETKPKSNMTTTPCGHSFCYECLSKHLEGKINVLFVEQKYQIKLNLNQLVCMKDVI